MRKLADRRVHGDDLLYDFFQHVLGEENEAFAAVPQLLIETMGIWLPLDVYEAWPVLLPFVVRDPNCRPNKSQGRAEEWGSPDDRGYLRDDNSLIKGLPRSLRVVGPRTRRTSGARMGTEFVAAHVWRTVIGTDVLASRIPALNSFVPNLVWLPGQIAKLTDREGSAVQQTVQAISWEIYRDAPVAPHLREVTKACWSALAPSSRSIAQVDTANLNWFQSTPGFFAIRELRLRTVIDALRLAQQGLPIDKKIVTSRYSEGLPRVSEEALAQLVEALERYVH